MREFPNVNDFASLRRELNRFFAARADAVRLTVLHAEPERYEDGDIVYADGTDWNPGGGGAGAYQRSGGAWVKI